MQAAIKMLEGKTIQFSDSEDPAHLDDDGVIHMKRPDEIKDDSIKIGKAIFANISVQGKAKSHSVQTEYNNIAFDELKLLVLSDKKEKLEEMQKKLQKGQPSYKLAEEFEEVLIESGIPLSHGCYGAKDRTGFVSFRTIFNKLCSSHKEDEKKYLEENYSAAVFSSKGLAEQVAVQNSGISMIKVSPINLPGISKKIRFSYLFKQGNTLIKSIINQKISTQEQES